MIDIDRENKALRRMRDFGGGFASRLAAAWLAADLSNREKLRAAFGDLLATYDEAQA